jgi:hypothetical protein
MKLTFRILFSITLAVTTSGQSSSPPAPPGVMISEFGWSPYRSRLSRPYSSSITVDDAASRARREKSRQGSSDEASGTVSPPSAPDPSIIGPKDLAGRRYGLLYRMTVENNGAKKIVAITWEYAFLDPMNRNIIARHQFLSKVKVSPGEKRVVSAMRTKHPAQVVTADASHLPPVEQIIIKRVKYSDGSVWVTSTGAKEKVIQTNAYNRSGASER